MNKLLSMLVLALATCVATSADAVAQAQYPPPAPTAHDDDVVCFSVDGDVDGRSVPGQVDHGGDITVAGAAGTAETNGKIELFVDSRSVKLGEFRALEDGSFALQLALPASVDPGPHRIIGVVEGCGESSVGLEVLGASVLAGSEERAVGGTTGGSGVLPRTGISILWYVLGALILVGIGALLLIVRNRHRARARHNADTSSTRVELFDTSSFVPRRTERRGS